MDCMRHQSRKSKSALNHWKIGDRVRVLDDPSRERPAQPRVLAYKILVTVARGMIMITIMSNKFRV